MMVNEYTISWARMLAFIQQCLAWLGFFFGYAVKDIGLTGGYVDILLV